MAQLYKFFNSAPGDSRSYQAADFADYFGSILSTGLIHTDSIPGMEVIVEDGSLRTYVSPGKAIMRGHLYENTTSEYLNHSLPESSADRIDRIVLRLDLRNSERNILLHIKEGDPSTNPTVPELQRDNFIYELSLAQIRVRANTSSFEPTDLIDERLDEQLCGLVNSMLTVPTSQFLNEWETFMDGLKNDGFVPTSTFNAHLEDYALFKGSSEIVEQGTNENGRYVRWANGIQICFNPSIQITRIAPSLIRVWTYPATFTTATTIIGNILFHNNKGVTLSNLSNIKPTTRSEVDCTLVVETIEGTTPLPSGSFIHVNVFAIGRWK
jgi:hypothetical protein